MHASRHVSFLEFEPAEWDALGDGANPFVSHAFLAGLERTGCIGDATGWRPMVVALRDERGLAAAVPGFLKSHSYGEFVFDFSWAQAYARIGLPYYPKLVVAAPFTPATGPRLLVRTDLDRAAVAGTLAQALDEAAAERALSSIHVLFPDESDRLTFERADWLLRRDCQFHWTNRGYRDFEDFLAGFTAEKRKKARRERRRTVESGIEFATLTGRTIGHADLHDAWSMHCDTFRRHGHEPYLNLAFFEHAARELGERLVIKLARQSGRNVATAIFFRGSDTLYGRYWGARGDHHSLHFEACYHQGIEFCIQHGLARFEPGTQGEHKVARGFEPTLTWSAHRIVEPRFRSAIADYLRREARVVDEYAAAVQQHVPFRARRADADGTEAP